MRQKIIIPLFAACSMVMTGCATQANLVDLEAEVAALKQRLGMDTGAPVVQLPEEGAVEAVMAAQEEQGVPPAEVLDLAINIDQLREDQARLQGQVDEFLHRMDAMARNTHSRLVALEQKAGIEGTAMPELSLPPLEEADAERDEAEDRSASRRSGGGISLPGVAITPRGGKGEKGSPETAFSLASRDLQRGHANLAAAGFANFIEQFPDSALVPQAMLLLGQSYRAQGMDERAVRVWKQQVERYPRHQVTPKALLALGDAYRHMDNIPAAEGALKRLIARYPDSEAAQEAKLLLSELR